MKKINKRILSAGIATAALAATTACGAVEGESGSDGSLPVVKFAATAMPSSIGTVAAVIEAENLDEACGINLDPLSFAPDAAETAAGSHRAGDIGSGHQKHPYGPHGSKPCLRRSAPAGPPVR